MEIILPPWDGKSKCLETGESGSSFVAASRRVMKPVGVLISALIKVQAGHTELWEMCQPPYRIYGGNH